MFEEYKLPEKERKGEKKRQQKKKTEKKMKKNEGNKLGKSKRRGIYGRLRDYASASAIINIRQVTLNIKKLYLVTIQVN